MDNNYKKNTSFEQRKNESERILNKYPDRIPIICEQSNNSKLQKLTKSKFLVPKDLTAGQFAYVIRKKIKLNQEQAIFLFINNTLPPTASMIGNLYNEHKDVDGFLYVVFSEEAVFGGN